MTRTAFIDGTIDIMRFAAVLVAIGFLASVFLIRRGDLHYEQVSKPTVGTADA